MPDVTETPPADSPKHAGPRTYDSQISDCVHCGFCLPACPTYNSWGEEMDSPRGRIDLMKGTSDGTIPLDNVVAGHIDACLGCMACVTACPSGVRYDLLIEATRARVEEAVPRSADDRAFRNFVFALFPYPRRLRMLIPGLWLGTKLGLTRAAAGPLGKLLPPRLRQLATMAPPISLRDAFASLYSSPAPVARWGKYQISCASGRESTNARSLRRSWWLIERLTGGATRRDTRPPLR